MCANYIVLDIKGYFEILLPEITRDIELLWTICACGQAGVNLKYIWVGRLL